MKKIIKKIIAIILAAATASCMLACKKPSLDDDKTGTDVDISTPKYGFVAQDSFTPNAEDPLEGTQTEREVKFEVGTIYYLIIVFTLTPRQENDGQSYFKTTARFDSLEVLDATMQQASTSSTSVEVSHDMIEDKVTRNVQASFKIGASTEDIKNYTMIVRMVPQKVSGSTGVQLKIEFSLDGNNKIWGADGFTRTIDIEKGTLATPIVEYDSFENSLSWIHVNKGASYYMVFDANDNPISFGKANETKSDKIMATNDIKPGKDYMHALLNNAWLNGEKLAGYHELKVKAFGKDGVEDESYYSSGYSETVEVNII